MRTSRITTCTLLGVDAPTVELACRITPGGDQHTSLPGLEHAAVRETRDRVRAAIEASGFRYPPGQIAIDVVPQRARSWRPPPAAAHALSILAASGQCEPGQLSQWAVYAELAADGRLLPAQGALAAATTASVHGLTGIIVAPENANEAALVGGTLTVAPARDLTEAQAVIAGAAPPARPRAPRPAERVAEPELLSLRAAHCEALQAVTIAAAGGHSLLLRGPADGRALALAQAMSALLPPLENHAAREVARIYGIAGVGRPHSDLMPPVRIPHPRSSLAGLLGGVGALGPGEVTLAHHGLLILDGLRAYAPAALEALLSVHESGISQITCGTQTVQLPARFQLVATTTCCPCGRGACACKRCRLEHGCTCTPQAIAEHQRTLDAIAGWFDLHATTAPCHARSACACAPPPPVQLRHRVMRARARQRDRLAPSDATNNAELGRDPSEAEVRFTAPARAYADRLRGAGMDTTRIVRVARTLADLHRVEQVSSQVLAAALALPQTAGSASNAAR